MAARWKQRIKIKHLLSEDDSDENAKETGLRISLALRSSGWYHPEVGMIADEFEDIVDLYHFNLMMNVLYDLADYDRVWVD